MENPPTNPINIQINNNLHSPANTPDDNPPPGRKSGRKFYLQYVLVPVVVAAIPLLAIYLPPRKGRPGAGGADKCKVLQDSLAAVTGRLQMLKKSRKEYTYDHTLLDSALLEEQLIELNQNIKTEKCGN